MKVKKLIKELKKLNQNLDILIRSRDGEIFSYDISHVIKAYENNGNHVLEFEGHLTEEWLEDLSKEDIKYIALHKPCYVIIPE